MISPETSSDWPSVVLSATQIRCQSHASFIKCPPDELDLILNEHPTLLTFCITILSLEFSFVLKFLFYSEYYRMYILNNLYSLIRLIHCA